MRYITLTVALLASSISVQAHDFADGDIIVDHPYTHPAPGVVPTGIAYMTITNAGDQPDRLVGVEVSDFERASLHRTEVADGIARMLPQSDGVEIPPGETVAFEAGGLHVMLEGLGGDPIELGETFEATLVFERAGRIDIVIAVDPRGAMPRMDHGDHEKMMDGAETGTSGN